MNSLIRKAMLVVVIASIVAACLWSTTRPTGSYNSVSYLARRYGVSKDVVRNLASAYDLDSDSLAQYGPEPFPVNYIRHTFDWQWDQSEHPLIYRKEIEAFVTGYVSRCDVGDTGTFYLFYSDSLRPITLVGLGSEALPLEVTYALDVTREGTYDDQIVQSISFVDLSDSGAWPWEGIAPTCNPPARY